MEEKLFKQDAKSVTDLLFDTKFFKDDITRDNMNSIEEFIQFLLQSRFDSYIRLEKIVKSIDKSKG